MSKEKKSKQDKHKKQGLLKIGAAALSAIVIVLTSKDRNNS